MQETKFNINTDPIKITVILATYNNEKIIENCIKSLINQTLCELQIIIIDDDSKDGTLNILYKYANQDDRILVLEQFKQNLDVARQAGLELAFGEYITFLEVDDILKPNQLFENYQNAINNINLPNVVTFNNLNGCFEISQTCENSYNRLIKRSYIEENEIKIKFKQKDNSENKINKLLNEFKICQEKLTQLQNTQSSNKDTTQTEKLKIESEKLKRESEKWKRESEKWKQSYLVERNEKHKCKGQLDYHKKEKENIKNSTSFKIGRVITWLPRKFQ